MVFLQGYFQGILESGYMETNYLSWNGSLIHVGFLVALHNTVFKCLANVASILMNVPLAHLAFLFHTFPWLDKHGLQSQQLHYCKKSRGIHTAHKVLRSSALSHLTGSFTGKRSAVCNTVQCYLQGVTLSLHRGEPKRLDCTLFPGKHYFFLGFCWAI